MNQVSPKRIIFTTRLENQPTVQWVHSLRRKVFHMATQVCMGATLQCSFGVSPSSLAVLPTNRTLSQQQPDANIMDYVPMVNVMPFGMCMSIANPAVAAATAAALGVLTPVPCVPVPIAPWTPGASTVNIAGSPALTSISTLSCSWAGVIEIVTPGEFTVAVS